MVRQRHFNFLNLSVYLSVQIMETIGQILVPFLALLLFD